MERITKVFFDPLAATKAQIWGYLEHLPVGSAHPFKPEQIILLRTSTGIEEIDISSYPEQHFFNAVDLGALGDILQQRMTLFQSQLKLFNDDYTVQQIPAATFKVPLSEKIAIFAVSRREPTYYDLCMADDKFNTSCYGSLNTLPGLTHSGDINIQDNLLQYITINERTLPDKAYTIFVSGFQHTKLTRYRDHNPVILVANHAEKVLFIVPVPLDTASIGDAILCCPMVIKRDGNSLVCSILPTPTTDDELMCSGSTLCSASFQNAIQRADFTMAPLPATGSLSSQTPQGSAPPNLDTAPNMADFTSTSELRSGQNVVLATQEISMPSIIDLDTTQVIRFDTGIEWMPEGQEICIGDRSSTVLPCILGGRLEGPMFLATGTTPSNVPFSEEGALHAYYEQAESVVVLVGDRMTDNARNLANSWRINALFVIQILPENSLEAAEVLPLLDSLNINAVTALAGPQSLVLVQLHEKYYFYRGIANRLHLNTSELAYGADVTDIVRSIGVKPLLDPRARRLVNLSEENTIILPTSGQVVQPQGLKKLFEGLSIDQIESMKDDISAVVPQLQALLNQKDLQDLSSALISIVSSKVSNNVAPSREAYIKFLNQEYQMGDPESVKQKNKMLTDLRKHTKQLQTSLNFVIQHLGNMMSSQTTSKRTHDLKRLIRQAAIQNNVESAQSMTFDTLSGILEAHASEMGVLLLNINTSGYSQLLTDIAEQGSIDANPCCDLDSRVLYLEGFDAGIILEQSQAKHDGPLKNQLGPTQPILALPYLTPDRGTGSMLAWVCWDEFVNLEDPFSVRWVEKCNSSHIAALRIIMRQTLSKAIASREYNMQPGSLKTGHLMSVLLMAAMSKLVGMRTTAPVVTAKADDTVTKLIRGLFGNLLTIAGSGVRPLSMVWQLLGTYPQLEIPSTYAGWGWYETVVRLYPYTGWPISQFKRNLEKILDKAIIRVITKNEQVGMIKTSRADELIENCKIRNIQLLHSRTVITIFMKMLTEDVDRKSIAKRLVEVIPNHIRNQTESYKRLYRYVKHLAEGGERKADYDVVAAHVYTKRSAAFSDLKVQLAKACKSNEEPKIKILCQEIMDKHTEVAKLWQVKPESLKVQNLSTYRELLDSSLTNMEGLFLRVYGDAELERVPWQIGKGEYGTIEPLDETLIYEIMTGESTTMSTHNPTTITRTKDTPKEMAQFGETVRRGFITKVESAFTGEAVSAILGIPTSTMNVFIEALSPTPIVAWEKLGANFKDVVIMLLQNRSNREASRPTRQLLGDLEPGLIT